LKHPLHWRRVYDPPQAHNRESDHSLTTAFARGW
jgi:hypothetical protein